MLVSSALPRRHVIEDPLHIFARGPALFINPPTDGAYRRFRGLHHRHPLDA